MIAAACGYGAGCSSSNNNGGTGGAGGAGTGGKADAGTGGTGTGGKADSGTDAGDAAAAATFTQVFAILSNVDTPTPDTAPGCAHCHDGLTPGTDAGATTLPHSMNFKDKATAFSNLVGVDSLRCTGADGGTQLKRILAGNPGMSVLVQKVRQGLGMGQACDGVGMPLNLSRAITDAAAPDGSAPDAGFDAGFSMTHYMVTGAQLQTIESWVSAGALNN
jgi:hypothetical protein